MMGDMCSFCLLLLAVALLPDLARAQTHCTQAEDVVFSCALKKTGKVVSVCASRGLAAHPDQGSLAYRVGPLGAPELIYPKTSKGSVDRFTFSHYFRSEVDRTELSFGIGGNQYSVVDDYEGDQTPAYTRGVGVSTMKGKSVMLMCAGKVQGKWGLIESVVPCDPDDEIGCSGVRR